MKKLITLILLLLASVLGMVFWKPLTLAIVERQLKVWSQEELGQTLSYGKASWEDDAIVITSPALIPSIEETSSGELRASAERLAIKCFLDFSKWKLAIHLSLLQPKIAILKKDPELPLPAFLQGSKASWLPIDLRFTVQEGQVELDDQSIPRRTIQRFFIDFDQPSQGDITGTLVIYFDRFSPSKNGMVIQVAQQPEGMNCNVRLDSLEGAEAYRVLRFFHGGDRGAWEVIEGTVSGTTQITFPHGRQPYMKGKIEVNEMTIIQPQFSLRVDLPELGIELWQREVFSSGSLPLQGSILQRIWQGTAGTAHLDKNAEVSRIRMGSCYWGGKELAGALEWQGFDDLRLALTGVLMVGEDRSSLNIEGSASVLLEDQARGSLVARIQETGKDNLAKAGITKTALKWRKAGKGLDLLELELERLGPKEYLIVQDVVSVSFPEFKDFHVPQGNLDGHFVVQLDHGRLKNVSLDNIYLKDVRFDLPSLFIYGKIGEVKGSWAANTSSSNLLAVLDTSVVVTQGEVTHAEPGQMPLRFSDIEAEVIIKKGVIQKSTIATSMAGLKGVVELDWFAPDTILHMMFSGNSKDLTLLLPDRIKNGLKEGFPDDDLLLVADVRRQKNGLQVVGNLEIKDAVNGAKNGNETIIVQSNVIRFGFDLEHVLRALWKEWPVNKPETRVQFDTALATFKQMSPALALPSTALMADWLDYEFGARGLVVRHGWFSGEDLPLKKYVSPFLFQGTDIKLTGRGAVNGFLDEGTIVLQYQAKDILMESRLFEVRVDEIGRPPASGNLKKQEWQALHYFDIQENLQFGFIPVGKGSFWDKPLDLHFVDASVLVFLEGERVHILNADAMSDGVHFAGRVDIDFSDFDAIKLEVATQKAEGTTAAVQRLFSRFSNSYFWKMPLQGNIATSPGDVRLKAIFKPATTDVDVEVRGMLTSGEVQVAKAPLHFDDLSMKFYYDSKANALELSDAQGRLEVGKGSQMNTYTVTSPNSKVYDFPAQRVQFDVRIEDETHDVVRLIGQGDPWMSPSGEECTALSFDKQSHVGHIQPNINKLVVKDWETVMMLDAEASVDLKTAVDDLQRLAVAAILPVTAEQVEEWKDLQLQGKLQTAITYDAYASLLQVRLLGDDVAINTKRINDFTLVGQMHEGKWRIDQLRVDNLSLTANFWRQEKSWYIDSLAMRYGQLIAGELQGEFYPEKRRLQATVLHSEIDLSHINELPMLTHIAPQWRPEVKLDGIGTVDVLLLKGAPWWRFLVHWDGSFKRLVLGDLYVQGKDEVYFRYSSEEGFGVEGIDVTVGSAVDDSLGVQIRIPEISYEFEKQGWVANRMEFAIPARRLGWVTGELYKWFPQVITPEISKYLPALKTEGEVAGSLSLAILPDNDSFMLTLADDHYYIMGRERFLKDFTFHRSPRLFKVDTRYHYRDVDYWVSLQSDSDTLEKGTLILSDRDLFSLKEGEKTPLTIQWDRRDLQSGQQTFTIQSMEGVFTGMDLNLHLDKERSLPGKLALSGKIGVDATKLKALLPQEAQALARRLQIGKGYEIIGQFSFPKDSLKDALKEISFEGTLGGKDFELLGYQLKTLTAAVQYGSGALSVTGLKINDVAGELNCQAVTVEKRVEPEINKPIAQSTRQPIGQEPELEEAAQDHWMVAIPLVEVKDLRPSLLQPVDGSKTGLKPLLVDSVELKDFRGDLSDSKTFTGSGELIFSRQANKTLENPLWAIPRDVLSRLGLDSRFFVPVMGQIHYAIKDARVTFPKFKDVYSQEKKSRFYLAKGDENPYIDFDGNININFRVKQYNIILKFAELFIVSIRGTLQNPTYDLLKPPPGQAVERDENDEELAPEGK